jgi:uncharacterized protein YjbI with pentapeptide repeats
MISAADGMQPLSFRNLSVIWRSNSSSSSVHYASFDVEVHESGRAPLDFAGAEFVGVEFIGVDFVGVDFAGAEFAEAEFAEAKTFW